MSKFWERFFFVFTFITQGSSYLSGYAYGLLHRLHHAHTDTELDPHSPSYDSNMFTMMWRTKNIYSDILNDRMEIEEKYKKDLPKWKWFDTFADWMVVRIAWVGVYAAVYYFFATEWWMWALVPVHVLMGPVHGVIINWFAHKYGYTNFKTDDTSKNFLPVDIFMMGEAYHNNHHVYGSRANFGVRWFEIDPVYYIILVFDKVGIIRLKNKKKQPAMAK